MGDHTEYDPEINGPPSAVRQLRVVVAADDFETALAFYRDALGLPQLAAFEGDGDAQVAILDVAARRWKLRTRRRWR